MDWKQLLGTVAPWIGTAMAGPLGGMAITAAADALGLSERTETAIKQAVLGASSEQMLALKQADQAFAARMQELGFDNEQKLESLASADRDSARKREMTLADNTPKVLAAAVTCGFFGAILLLALVPTPESREPLLVLVGTLGTAWTQVISYFFGSTAGGKLKSELLAKSTP